MEATEEDQQALLGAEREFAAGTRTTTDSSEVASLQLSLPQLLDSDRPVIAQLFLYASHLLSTWGQRMWEFAIGLIMLELYPSSLALVSAYGLVDGLAKVFSGSVIGSYIDRYSIGLSLSWSHLNFCVHWWCLRGGGSESC